MAARLVGIGVHPVKSTAIRPCAHGEVRPWGLVGDRRWMIVDGNGVLLSAREDPTLFTLVADTPATDATVGRALRLSAPHRGTVDVAEPEGDGIPVRLHRHDLYAVPAAPAATNWLRAALGRPDVTLVWCNDPTRRALNPAYARPGEHTALADGYPVTLVSMASVRQLSIWVAQVAAERGEPAADPVPVERFRANLVVDGGLEPFEEDGWRSVTIGAVRFRVAKGIDRCSMTLIDPESLARGREPIRTLARHRQWDGVTWFGLQLIPDDEGHISVNDLVTPEEPLARGCA